MINHPLSSTLIVQLRQLHFPKNNMTKIEAKEVTHYKIIKDATTEQCQENKA